MPAAFFQFSLVVLWSTLGVAKVIEPRQFIAVLRITFDASHDWATRLAWTVVSLEIVMAGLLVSCVWLGPVAKLRVGRLSWLFAAIMAGASLLTRHRGDCGCFGVLVVGTLPARLIVAGAIMWLSFELVRTVRGGLRLNSTGSP